MGQFATCPQHPGIREAGGRTPRAAGRLLGDLLLSQRAPLDMMCVSAIVDQHHQNIDGASVSLRRHQNTDDASVGQRRRQMT